MSDAIPLSVIEMTWGPYVTGIMLQQLFLGVIVVQIYDYYRVFPYDHISYKVLVAALGGVTLLQGIMDYVNLYRCAVLGYGDFNVFDLQNWSLWWEIGVTAIIGSICQGFFLERCWTATKNWFALVFGGAAILVSLGSGIASTLEFQRVQRLSRVPEIPIPITLWLVSTAVIDMFLSLVLIWSLVRVKTNFLKTESVIARIVRLTFTTGSLTAAVAILNVILYLALPGEAYHLLPQLSMGKMYVISVMVTLASRAELRDIMHKSGNATYVETTRNLESKADFTTVRGRNVSTPGGIEVQTTVHITDDDGKNLSAPSERKTRLASGATGTEIELGKVGRGGKADDQWSISDSDVSGKYGGAAAASAV